MPKYKKMLFFYAPPGKQGEELYMADIDNPVKTAKRVSKQNLAAFPLLAVSDHEVVFIDGNKRVAAISAIAFLRINGFNFQEDHDEQFADIIIDFLNKKKTKKDLAKYFENNSKEIFDLL